MAIDPVEMMSPRERLAYNINMRAPAADGSAPPPPSGQATPADSNFFGPEGFTFDTFLDIVNPLQHLPIVSMVYRAVTGDQISPGARVIGGGLFGGPAGAIFGALDAAIAESSGGKDLGAIALNTITGDTPDQASPDKTDTAATADAGAELGAVAPAAGEIEESHAPTPWVDPDSPPAEGPMATPGGLPAAEPPRRLLPASTTSKPPASAASTPQASAGSIPELSEDQVALLLSSVGIGPKAEPAAVATPAPSPETPPAAPVERQVKPVAAKQFTSPPRRDASRVVPGPMKQTYVRVPSGSNIVAHAPITPEMRSHMSQPVVSAGDADPAWVSAAMASALDKYRNGKVLEQGDGSKGGSIDGSF